MNETKTPPDTLEITAETDEGVLIGIRHKDWPLEGVQFHPESILTEGGKNLLRKPLLPAQAA